MPSILINEQDLTTGGVSANNTNVVYVPGCMGVGATDPAEIGVPVLCSTISQFERYFGKTPSEIKKIKDGTYESMGHDKSYIYAKELINLGLPVLYEVIYDPSGYHENGVQDIADIYDILSGHGSYTTDDTPAKTVFLPSPYDKLSEVAEYKFKYLTSGGYGNFEVGGEPSEALVNVSGLNVDVENFNQLDDLTDEDFKSGPNSYTYVFKNISGDTWRVSKIDGNLNYVTGPEPTNRKEMAWVNATMVFDDTSYHMVVNTKTLFSGIQPESYSFITGDEFRVTINNKSEVIGRTFDSTANAPSPIAYKIANVASSRGDCIGLIDHDNDADKKLTGTGSYYKAICDTANSMTGADCCAAFTPWVNINCVTYTPPKEANKSYVTMPPSFAYLSALAYSIRTNASWLAVAGATRGQVPNLDGVKPLNINSVLTNSIAENEYQNRGEDGTTGVSINAITNIKPFGYRIWGNRTLKNNAIARNLTATSFLNIRNMICDVKKIAYEACKKYTFEQNNDVLWLNFKSYIEPVLSQMKTGAGLSGYKIIKGTTSEKAKLVAVIKLYPIYAVEDFDITVQMLDDEISVS